ncbi:hypothetical protein pEaSNUABM28_00317 [Erwinia phage pEa_SNUABM_28]|uniref:Uncharacterized protein n=2 Tax=Alexandravirus TaxID=2733088 RepID=A0AAE9BUQ8_9CAUD|nr:hypothetical protein MPK63_gp316 [Erwinia phage pEa_SNUABM_22]YP_010300076.1 hypothetical protein MPK64_gp315 [Erwinia phage pEa_SNUABM_16]QZE58874.1 hypothetical protein pEaSNUABM28_00317 [Erwinia phage pEa_SNUABM_28]QZE59217.1 hypothetical protein pEaSNUABM18_00314 [Erwinia phage pEa_SNUABM_18]UAW96459.1 hypothetical protein pEaSNUABM16_00315 [Erwinia phage pEa_SNUABM_16]UAW96804.1 hypothetical protein pEaSNUABM22_00317 [Erwinia phage pEa_SNUABM_22]
MQFEQNILVVNRVALIMGDDLVAKWGEAANANRDQAAYATIVILSRLQQKVIAALAAENPEACCRPDLLWTDYGSISTSGLFVIASSADREVLNHFEDHDYLNHLHTIKRVAEENGFTLTVTPVKHLFPFANTEIPANMK